MRYRKQFPSIWANSIFARLIPTSVPMKAARIPSGFRSETIRGFEKLCEAE
jgi:hypothetical protein